jgi:hypothetical protein
MSEMLYILLIQAMMDNMDRKFLYNDTVSLYRPSEPHSIPGAESIVPYYAAQPFK